MRIGLFGGTFNPVHNGHLEIAEKVIVSAVLDRIIFIPSYIPPHKTRGALADAALRYRMIDLALPPDPRYGVSRVELDRKGSSYTIDTISHFLSTGKERAKYFLVMGLDAFLEIHTWKSYKKLLALIEPIVVFRKDEKDGNMRKGADGLTRYINGYISGAYDYVPDGSRWTHDNMKTIHFLGVDPVDISSTRIRELRKQGGPFGQYVPHPVALYIEEKGLYL